LEIFILWFTVFFWLLIGHAVADYSLQTDFIAKGKNRHTAIPGLPWYYIMSAHALIHGGAVGVITGSLCLSLAETLLHFGIDVLKCEGKTNIHQDQIAHVVCKMVWAAVVVL
jgi:hypothetical protein